MAGNKFYLDHIVKHRSAKGLTYWCPEKSSVSLTADVIMQNLFHTMNCSDSGIYIHKTDKRMSVAKVCIDGQNVLFKTYRLKTLRDKRKHHFFSEYEVSNHLRALSMNIAVPKYCGHFTIRPMWVGPVTHCGLMVEYLDGYMELGQYYQEPGDILRALTDIIVMFYRKGINHIDLSPTNVFIHPETKNKKIIDWQYCNYPQPRNDVQLILHISQCLKYVDVFHEPEVRDKWIAQVHQASGCLRPLDVILGNVARLYGKRRDTDARLNLDAKAFGITL